MTTPPHQNPNQPPDPASYQPQSGAFIAPPLHAQPGAPMVPGFGVGQPGDCMYYGTESDNGVVDCASDKAQYRVEARLDSSTTTGCNLVADSDIALYSMEDSAKPFTLCVSLVLSSGSCVSGDSDVIDCAKPGAVARVTSIHQGAKDDSVCAAGEFARIYKLRPRVVCLTKVG